jgi:serine/threonine-protein kinase
MPSSLLEMGAGSVAPGDLIAGKFRVTGLLGEGGMAFVLDAHHEGLDMRVALKVMKADAAKKVEVRARFSREAKAVATLRSDHVARVLDVGETDDGRPFMVIEHLAGRDLAQILADDGPLPIARAVDLTIQACVGLADAHARGIVHRDVKPANLFLAKEVGGERLKLLDFGISKLVRGAAPSPVITTTELMGSPAYMSPEQLRSSCQVDARTDIWSLGAVLFELLSGAPPFGGLSNDFYAVITSILHDGTPSLRARRRDTPEALEEVIRRCLEKEPDARIAGAAALAEELVPFGGSRARDLAQRALAAGASIPPDPSSAPSVTDKAKTDSVAATLYVPTVHPAMRVSGLRPLAYRPTRCASGASMASDTVKAVREAVLRAQLGLENQRVALAVLFASARHDIGRAAEEVGTLTAGASVLACSTAGEFTERGLTKRGLSVLLVASEDLRTHVTFADAIERAPDAAVTKLCDGFEAASIAARQDGLKQSTTLALFDGLSAMGESIVDGLLANTRGYQRIVGGAAADDGAFIRTQVATKERAASEAAATAHVFTRKPWGIGVAHGLAPSTGRMRVTRAKGNRIYEIDRRPAFEVYREYARTKFGIDLVADKAAPFLVQNELGIYYFDALRNARAALRVESDWSLVCAGNVPEGASVCILTGDTDSMIQAARRAASEAAEQLEGSPAAGVLVFDCVCREAMLGPAFDREINAIAQVFPQAPIAGFLTYGEIARARGRLEGWHNATVVVVAIPA